MPKGKWIYRWQHVSKSGKVYTVAITKHGEMGCSCPAWRFAKAPKPDCKHIAYIKRTKKEQIRDILNGKTIMTPTAGIPETTFKKKNLKVGPADSLAAIKQSARWA